jgi:hypothetical protein
LRSSNVRCEGVRRSAIEWDRFMSNLWNDGQRQTSDHACCAARLFACTDPSMPSPEWTGRSWSRPSKPSSASSRAASSSEMTWYSSMSESGEPAEAESDPLVEEGRFQCVPPGPSPKVARFRTSYRVLGRIPQSLTSRRQREFSNLLVSAHDATKVGDDTHSGTWSCPGPRVVEFGSRGTPSGPPCRSLQS